MRNPRGNDTRLDRFAGTHSRTRSAALRRFAGALVVVALVASVQVAGIGTAFAAVGSPTVTLSTTAAGAHGVVYTIGFTTSGSGALAANTGTITLSAPATTVFPSVNAVYTITDDTASMTAGGGGGTADQSGGTNTATIAVPFAIAAGHHVTVVATGVTNVTGTGAKNLAISTSGDTAANAAYTTVSASAVSAQTVATSTTAAGATNALYTIDFTTSATGALQPGLADADLFGEASTITLTAPAGTVFPASQNQYSVTDVTASSTTTDVGCCGRQVTLTNSNSTASFPVPMAIAASHHVRVVVTGVTNPSSTGAHNLGVSTSDDTSANAASTTVTASAVVAPAVSLSTGASGASRAVYEVDFTTSATGALQPGLAAGPNVFGEASTITLAAATGTAFPPAEDLYTITDVTASTTLAVGCCGRQVTLTNSNSTATIAVPFAIPAGHHAHVEVIGVTNPSSTGAKSVAVSTSSDTAASAAYATVAASPVSAASVTVSPPVGGITSATYTVAFTTSATGAIQPGISNNELFQEDSEVTLQAAAGTVFPGHADQYRFYDATGATATASCCGTPVTLSNSGATATFRTGLGFPADARVILVVTGVTNPATLGTQNVVISTTSDTVPASAPFNLSSGVAVSGTVTAQGGGAVNNAGVQLCPIGGGPCSLVVTGADGTYSSIQASGSYTATAGVYGSATNQTATRTPVVVATTPLTGVDFVLPAVQDAPPSVVVNGQAGGVFSLRWERSESVTITSCNYGLAKMSITAINPSTGLPGTVFVDLVETPFGSGTYKGTIPPITSIHGDASINYKVLCTPNVAMTPQSGPTAGGTHVIIVGANFTGATAVKFGTTAARSFKVLTDWAIDAVSPAGTGSVDVSVTTPGGTTAVAAIDRYTYAGVSSLTPASGPITGSTPVVIHGSGFRDPGTGVSAVAGVLFGNTPTQDFQIISDTEIDTFSPPGAGTVNVRVAFVGSDSTVSTKPFTYAGLAQPHFSAHAAAPVATAVVSPPVGGTVHANEIPPELEPIVKVIKEKSGQAGNLDIIDQMDNHIAPFTAAILSAVACYAGNAGSPDVDAKCGTGGFIDPSGNVLDTHGNPVVGATVTIERSDTPYGPFIAPPDGSPLLSPATNPETTDADGFFMWDVVGGYYRVRAVKAGCTSPNPPHDAFVLSPVFPIPPPVTGLVLTLSCPAAAAPTPVVSTLSRTTGPTAGGTKVIVSGHALNGATVVKFGTKAATAFTVNSPTNITATVPAGTATVDVRVSGPGGTSAVAATDKFRYVTAPAVTSISPTYGVPAGGRVVVVTGVRLSLTSQVLFGTKPAANIFVLSDTTLRATAPAGTGVVDVTVTTRCARGDSVTCGTSTKVGADHFAFTTATPPAAPTGVHATAHANSAVVTWKAPAAHGATISSYTVVATPGGRSATVTGTHTSATVTGLTNGVTYHFRVTARNVAGTGPPSSYSNGAVPRAGT